MAPPKWSLSLKGAMAPAKAPAAGQARLQFDEEDAPSHVPNPSSRSAAPVSKAVRRQQAEAEAIDASTFDYDGVYDKMKQVERDMRQAKKEEDKSRKPKYMQNFMEAAEIRERDRLRAESKMIQRQRAAEGDEFAGKEAFVTSAYKEQQEELQRAEEEESIREARERQRSRGVAAFHQKILDEESRRRQATVDALADLKPDDAAAAPVSEEVTDRMKAEQAAKQGLKVELNDDHQIVDRRDLLQRGLNVMRKRKEPDNETQDTPPVSSRAKRSQLMEEALLAKLMGSDEEDSS
ncbi:alternative mRNA splicing regulator [Malassezia pachydermatis]|uniref:Nuclear speckle splicing regulatory protein 1 N-terminal domain-containing protein n=1 Tax=Malassezia pachydermatis TaxID=77020 RepID=A0A0M8MNB5_9BASI|nr:hypothetical protein Malapachy_0731 [Malassezia pachydermatis]KOS15028.1 hypothetical protein Malapachy_0731 [Malassezia pachydermatis]